MSKYFTPACPMTDEDIFIMGRCKNMKTMAGMLVYSISEHLLFSDWAWNLYNIKLTEYEENHVY